MLAFSRDDFHFFAKRFAIRYHVIDSDMRSAIVMRAKCAMPDAAARDGAICRHDTRRQLLMLLLTCRHIYGCYDKRRYYLLRERVGALQDAIAMLIRRFFRC